MSREKRKNLKRGIKQPLVAREQRVRASRHNKPHTHQVFKQVEQMVVPGTPGARRSIEPIKPGVVYPDGTVFVDGSAIVHKMHVSIGRQVEVAQAFTRAVAAGPTGTYGQQNGEAKAAPVKQVLRPR